MMASVFLKVEGNTVKNRIWDFLIVHSELDYSMREIARYSKVSYASLKTVWKEFTKRKIVVHTRDIGNAKLYKLNVNNPPVKKFIDYFWSVIESVVEKEFKKEPNNHINTSSVGAVAVSARNV